MFTLMMMMMMILMMTMMMTMLANPQRLFQVYQSLLVLGFLQSVSQHQYQYKNDQYCQYQPHHPHHQARPQVLSLAEDPLLLHLRCCRWLQSPPSPPAKKQVK